MKINESKLSPERVRAFAGLIELGLSYQDAAEKAGLLDKNDDAASEISERLTLAEKQAHLDYAMKAVAGAQLCSSIQVEAMGKAWPLDAENLKPADLVDALLGEAVAAFATAAFCDRAEFAPDWPSDPRNPFMSR